METVVKVAEKAKIMFERVFLAAYIFISSPGKYSLEVQSNVTDANLVTDEDGSNPRYIVSLKAIAIDKADQLRMTFVDVEEVEIEKTKGLFLTANIWKRAGQTPRLPMKGEKVNAIVGLVPLREGGEALRVKNIQVVDAINGETLDLETFFKKEEVDAEKSADLVHK